MYYHTLGLNIFINIFTFNMNIYLHNTFWMSSTSITIYIYIVHGIVIHKLQILLQMYLYIKVALCTKENTMVFKITVYVYKLILNSVFNKITA